MATRIDVGGLLASAQLDEAITQMNQQVRANPSAIEPRAMLAELLCVAGNLERADVLLDAITGLDPGAAVGVALFRQLVRAEQARQQFYTQGRLPDFVVKPDEVLELELKAAVALREGAQDEARDRLAERDAKRTAIAGTADGEPFDELRDLDDLSAGHLEVLTSNGKYLWVPLSIVSELEFRRPERQRDLLWPRARLAVTEGPEGEIFIPAVYFAADSTPAQRLGHETSFVGESGAPVLGRGLRTFLVGETSRTIHELGKLTFAAAGKSS
jgi:type VI secretion system protein ImpE